MITTKRKLETLFGQIEEKLTTPSIMKLLRLSSEAIIAEERFLEMDKNDYHYLAKRFKEYAENLNDVSLTVNSRPENVFEHEFPDVPEWIAQNHPEEGKGKVQGDEVSSDNAACYLISARKIALAISEAAQTYVDNLQRDDLLENGLLQVKQGGIEAEIKYYFVLIWLNTFGSSTTLIVGQEHPLRNIHDLPRLFQERVLGMRRLVMRATELDSIDYLLNLAYQSGRVHLVLTNTELGIVAPVTILTLLTQLGNSDIEIRVLVNGEVLEERIDSLLYSHEGVGEIERSLLVFTGEEGLRKLLAEEKLYVDADGDIVDIEKPSDD